MYKSENIQGYPKLQLAETIQDYKKLQHLALSLG